MLYEVITQQLAAEAHTEYPDPARQRRTHRRHLIGHPGVGQAFVVDRPPGTQCHDDVEVQWIGERDIEHRIVGSYNFV